jgi:mRNA interferase RelE/StbE
LETQIIFSEKAEKELFKLTKSIARRIVDKIVEFSTDIPPILRANKLVNFQDAQFRYRIGDYRVLFDYDESLDRIEILKIAHRREVYF